MKRSITAFIFMALMSLPMHLLYAQKSPSLVIKGGLLSAIHQDYKLALEWRPQENLCFELSGGYRLYNNTPKGTINGRYYHEYALRRTYNKVLGEIDPQNDTGWEYFGTGRSISSEVPDGVTPLFTWRMSLGFRIDYPTKRKQVNFFFQPSVSTALHRKLEATDPSPLLINETTDDWSVPESRNTRVVTQTNYFTQQQEILIKNTWFLGPAVILGWSWHTPKGFIFEARGNVGVNFGKITQAERGYLTELAPLYGQFDLMVGYCFGGKTFDGKANL